MFVCLCVQDVWPWVDALVYSIIPFVAILVLNILIMRQVACKALYFHHMPPNLITQTTGIHCET